MYIFTDLTVAITRTIKGPALPANIIVRTLGGTVAPETQLPPFGTPFAVGQQVVLLLDGPDSNNKYLLSNGSLGLFRLQQDIHGQTLAIIDSGYSSMELGVALDPSYTAFLTQSSNSLLSLDALIADISSAQ
jgi:hypothetical protein